MAIAAAAESAVLEAVTHARKERLAEPILIGPSDRIRALADEGAIELDGIEIIEVADPAEAATKAVRLVHDGYAQLLMKGLVRTRDFVRAVLNDQYGLRRGRALSHVGVFESPDRTRLMMLTDPGINIKPNFNRKIAIIENAVELARSLGIAEPKVAVIAAVETVTLPTMPATLDAALLKRLGDAGRFGPCIIDGPLAMDNALSAHTAKVKGRVSPIAGEADIVVVPDIECGNAVYKTISYLAQRTLASLIVGARGPVVTASRSDTPRTKLYSIALGALLSRATPTP